jgi:phage terminase large subunit-like protein
MYSKDQRDKTYEVFNGSIKPAIEPMGYLIASGTPYHKEDMYGKIAKNKAFKSFEYPCVYPDGTLLSPDRFTVETLLAEKISMGTIAFTREYMVVPVSDDSSIFPWEYLKMAFIGMDRVRYVDSINEFPIKLTRVVVGADFAKSANVGADFTVYTVWGIDSNGILYLLHIWKKRGASYDEQVNQLVSLDHRFRPNRIVCESNGFQSIIADEAVKKGLKNVQPFVTTSDVKKNWKDGLPSLSAQFERGEIKMPRGSDQCRETTDQICSEFNSISFRSDSGKLESTTEHDDTVMSSFFAISELRQNSVQFRAYTA